MVNKVFTSLAITSLISGLLAYIFISHWISVFIIAFILQLVIFYYINTWIENNLIERAMKLRLEERAEQDKQLATIECPCGEKNKQTCQIRFDQENVYECDKCKKNIKATIDIKPVLMTMPIYFDDKK